MFYKIHLQDLDLLSSNKVTNIFIKETFAIFKASNTSTEKDFEHIPSLEKISQEYYDEHKEEIKEEITEFPTNEEILGQLVSNQLIKNLELEQKIDLIGQMLVAILLK